jgi:hypothetical protein
MPKLNRVVQQLQTQRKKAEQEIQKLDLAIRALSSLHGPGLGGLSVRRKPRFSAAARGRIAAAQRARWARIKAAQKKA